MTGTLEVADDLNIRLWTDPIPAKVGGQPVAIAREKIPEGLKVGDTVTVIPLPGTRMVAISSFSAAH